MHAVLSQKKQEVVALLIQSLTAQNKDVEKCLNAHYVLAELSDNENTYGKLVEKDNLTMIIRAACDINNEHNSIYALNIIIRVIKEFPDYEKKIGSLANEFTQTIGNHFLDLTYSCLIFIRHTSPSEELEFNQAGFAQRKFGFRRFKALELIKQELQTLSKYVELNSDHYISHILRK